MRHSLNCVIHVIFYDSATCVIYIIAYTPSLYDALPIGGGAEGERESGAGGDGQAFRAAGYP
eukprot:COSAG02_NODE_21330_length_793_cov_0.766571_1_plen_61_part_10